MSEVNILFKSHNTTENEIVEYIANADYQILDGNSIVKYIEPETNCYVDMYYNSKEIIINRNGDYYSKMVFLKEGKSFATYYLENNRIDFELNVVDLKISKKKLLINYEIILHGNENTCFKLEIKID